MIPEFNYGEVWDIIDPDKPDRRIMILHNVDTDPPTAWAMPGTEHWVHGLSLTPHHPDAPLQAFCVQWHAWRRVE